MIQRIRFALIAAGFLAALSLSPITARAGACGRLGEIGLTRKIDGPANVRERPDDETKIIASLPNGARVVIVNYIERIKRGKALEWYYIEWAENGVKREGWTAAQNIVCD